ncbi:hypothetical protein [Paenibacillus sp. SI8]|uniref:hypothetical protein n=1 Tax=unclassified Paenibacillus TaxID=185978 RepID=UPI0034667D0D
MKRLITVSERSGEVDMETGEILYVESKQNKQYTPEELKYYRMQDITKKVKKYKVGGEYV